MHMLALFLFFVLPIDSLAYANGSKQQIPMLTVETRRVDKTFSVPGVPGREFTNVGANRTWRGWKQRLELYLSAARSLARQKPEAIIIFADGDDVAFGGCTEDEMLRRYHATVNASGGASVIAGGDFTIWPWFPEIVENLTWQLYQETFGARKASVLAEFGKENPYAGWFRYCAQLQWLVQEIRVMGLHPGDEYSFANAGFMMGPAQKVVDIMECQHHVHWDSNYDDEHALNMCLFRLSQHLTIDYSGLLALLPTAFDENILEYRNGMVYNKAYQQVQCLMHYAGGDMRPKLAKMGLGLPDWEPPKPKHVKVVPWQESTDLCMYLRDVTGLDEITLIVLFAILITVVLGSLIWCLCSIVQSMRPAESDKDQSDDEVDATEALINGT